MPIKKQTHKTNEIYITHLYQKVFQTIREF